MLAQPVKVKSESAPIVPIGADCKCYRVGRCECGGMALGESVLLLRCRKCGEVVKHAATIYNASAKGALRHFLALEGKALHAWQREKEGSNG